MLCTNCGARLQEADQFCPKCGTKAIKDRRCPDCGALLREGVKFCPKCGRAMEGKKVRGVSEDTLDIPIDAIERNILSETASEIKADHRAPVRKGGASSQGRGAVPRSTSTRSTSERSVSERSGAAKASSSRSASEKNTSERRVTERSASGKSAPVKKRPPAPEPPKKKRAVYREEDWEEDDWEEDDWEEDDWDEDDWDDDEDGVDVITIMTAIVGCVLLIVVAVLGFHLFRQYVPKDYDKVAEEEQEEQQEQAQQGQEQQGQEQKPDGGENTGQGDGKETVTLLITHNVNVRNNPSTYGTDVIKVAQEGETYTSYGSVDGGEWYEILLEDGTTGYVFHEYISIE